MRRRHWKSYICYTFGLVVMGLHLVLKYSISYMELDSVTDNTAYPRELPPGGVGPGAHGGEGHLHHENCIHHRQLQQNGGLRIFTDSTVRSPTLPDGDVIPSAGYRIQKDSFLYRESNLRRQGQGSGPSSTREPHNNRDRNTGEGIMENNNMKYKNIGEKTMGDKTTGDQSAADLNMQYQSKGDFDMQGGFPGDKTMGSQDLTDKTTRDNITKEHGIPDKNRGVLSDAWLRTYLSPDHSTDQENRGFTFTCNNIDQIVLKRKLGQGVTKQVYLGQYGGRKVAVKMITRNVIDVKSCLLKLKRNLTGVSDFELPKETQRCYTLPNMKLMKEILILHQIQHPNLLKLLGYCARSEETESTSLQDHGVLAVYEYGLPFYPSTLAAWPWELRARAALELADLLAYLHASPLGSLRIADFKEIHFLMKDGRIKLTDLDDMTSLEPKCDLSPDSSGKIKIKSGAENQGKMKNKFGSENIRLNLNILDVDSENTRQKPSSDLNPKFSLQHQGAKTDFNLNLDPNTDTKNQLNQNQAASANHDPSAATRRCGYNLECVGGICVGFNALHNIAHMNKHYFQQLLYGNCGDHDDLCSDVRNRLNNLDITAAQLKELMYQMMQVSYVPGYA